MIVANLSGGRDSTCMVVKYLEMGNNIDYIIFCDTEYEFKEMYEYIDKLEAYLLRNFNKKITRLKAENGIYHWAFIKPITKGENINRMRGLPKTIGKDYCTRETKIKPTSNFVRNISPNKFLNKILIGYTYNEVENGRNSNLDYGISLYPLHEWKYNEPEIDSFLKKRGIINPLYEKFNRTGCFLCPKQSLASLYNLYRFYPKEWEMMKKWEAKAKELNCVTQTFRSDGKNLESLESKFKEKGLNDLFEYKKYETFDSCFCKG